KKLHELNNKQAQMQSNMREQLTASLKQTYEDKIKELSTALQEANLKLTKQEEKLKEFDFEKEANLRAKEQAFELEKSNYEKQIKDLKNEIWTLEAQLKTANEKYGTTKKALDERKQYIQNLEQKLLDATKLENELKRQVVQKQLD